MREESKDVNIVIYNSITIFMSTAAPCDYDMVFQSNTSSLSVTIEQAVEESLQAFTLSLWIRSTLSPTTDAVILSYMAPGSSPTLQAAEFAISDPHALTIFIKG